MLSKPHGWTHAVTEVSTPTGKDTYGCNETGDLTFAEVMLSSPEEGCG